MSVLQVFKVNALPQTYQSSALYLVKSSDPALMEMYLSDLAGTSVRKIPTKADILALIAANSSSGPGATTLSIRIVTEASLQLIPATLHILVKEDAPTILSFPASTSNNEVYAVVNSSSRTDHKILRNGNLIKGVAQDVNNIDILNTPINFQKISADYGFTPILTLSGLVQGSTLTGDASALLNLNAGNLAIGTVPVARLGSGTKDATTVLHGDNVFKIPSINRLAATAALPVSLNVAASSVQIGLFNNVPLEFYITHAAVEDNRVSAFRSNADGSFGFYLYNDALNLNSSIFLVTRNANTATDIAFTSNTLTLNSRVDFARNYTELNNAITATASTAINCALGNIFSVAMNASITALTFSNIPPAGRVYNMTLILTQDATGGRAITWPAAIRWPGGTAPTLSGANKTDIVTLMTTNGGTTWFGIASAQNY